MLTQLRISFTRLRLGLPVALSVMAVLLLVIVMVNVHVVGRVVSGPPYTVAELRSHLA